MKLSARNQIAGRVISVNSGALNGTVKIDVDSGTILTSSIPNEAIEHLALADGDAVTASVAASDVLIGK